MKLRGVRLLGKFVFNDRPGVFKKVRHDRAKCVFGLPDVVGSECDLDPDADVFVLDERPQRATAKNVANVIIQDDDGNTMKEIRDIEWDKVSALVSANCIKVRMPGKQKPSYLAIDDVGVDLATGSVFIEVRDRTEDMTR